MDQIRKQLPIVLGVLIKDGKVLLDLRNEPDCKEAHMRWELPGGKIEFGETPEEAIVREFREETGYIVKVVSLIPKVFSYVWDYPWGQQQVHLIGYILEYVSEKSRAQDERIEDVAWVPLEELSTKPLLKGTKEMIDLVIQKERHAG